MYSQAIVGSLASLVFAGAASKVVGISRNVGREVAKSQKCEETVKESENQRNQQGRIVLVHGCIVHLSYTLGVSDLKHSGRAPSHDAKNTSKYRDEGPAPGPESADQPYEYVNLHFEAGEDLCSQPRNVRSTCLLSC